MLTEEPRAAAPGPADPLPDAQLMQALVHGDRQALGVLYDRHAAVLLALARRILQDAGQAEELLHDILLEAWHHARDYDPARGTVRAWLVTRTRSRALDRRATRARHATLAAQAERERERAAAAAAEAGAGTDAERLRQQVSRLPVELLTVLELAYFEGLSSAVISERVGIPIGTVKSRLARAVAALRDQLVPGGEGAP
jgi:RNA polymerase sigma-70 factor (ECF subfamily)